jgi:16S rRNA (guanine(527)-N(7))-methyltransferase RsmG
MLSAAMPDLMTTHARLLEKFRKSMNLVGPGSAAYHFEDCRQALKNLEPAGSWADLGSGAGFPGLVFAAMYPDVALDLVDSRAKRCWFLEHVLTEAEVDHPVVRCMRVEQLPDAHYDGLMARAFAPPDRLLAHAARLLVPGGRVVLFLLGDAPQPARDGFEHVSSHSYDAGGRPLRAVVMRKTRG